MLPPQQVIFDYTAYNEAAATIDSSYRKGQPAQTQLGIQGLIPGAPTPVGLARCAHGGRAGWGTGPGAAGWVGCSPRQPCLAWAGPRLDAQACRAAGPSRQLRTNPSATPATPPPRPLPALPPPTPCRL